MWTDERISYLKANWGPDKPARELAAELGLPSKNAVIGKARRLGLPPLKVGPKTKFKPGHGVVKRSRPEGVTKAKRRQIFLDAITAKSPAVKKGMAAGKELAPPPAYVEPIAPADDVARVAGLLDLEPHHCRWPIDTDAGRGYCGARKLDGKSYCAGHHARAHDYRPAAQRPNYTHPSVRVFA